MHVKIKREKNTTKTERQSIKGKQFRYFFGAQERKKGCLIFF